MAIEWGNWDYGGGNGMRVGIEYSTSSVNNGSSSCAFTYDIWTDNQYSYNDSGQKLTYSGDIGGSTTFNNNQGSSQVQRASKVFIYYYGSNSYGSSPGKSTATAKISGTYNGVTPSQTISHTIPTRPIAAPSSPSGGSAAEASATTALLRWQNNATSGRPYNNQTVNARRNTGGPGGTNGWTGYTTLNNVGATATSYTHSGMLPNSVYQYQLTATNDVDTSGGASCGSACTTPAAPSNIVATINGTGIDLDWTMNSYRSSTPNPCVVTVQRSVNGGAFATVATLGEATNSWTDDTPGSGTNQYQIAVSQQDAWVKSSPYVTSNTVTTVTPPLAPTGLLPNGTAVDLSKNQTFSWTHHPGTDGAAQQACQLRFSQDGGKTWTNIPVQISATPSYVLPANTFVNGTGWTWQVATRGVDTGGFGPWSASASLSVPPYIFEQWSGSALSGRTLDGMWNGSVIQANIIASVETVK
jgi:hypothetical protein